MEDEKIVELYWSRNEDAILMSKEKYQGYCERIAKNVLYNIEDSEECVNDTWLRAWDAIPPDWPKVLAAFLGSITRNLSLDRYRKNHAKKRGHGEVPYLFDELRDCVSEDTIEGHLNTLELGGAINSFLGKLEKEQRMIFVRRYWYMDSTKAIAERFKLSQSKVKSSLFRTRKKLRLYLESEGIAI